MKLYLALLLATGLCAALVRADPEKLELPEEEHMPDLVREMRSPQLIITGDRDYEEDLGIDYQRAHGYGYW